MADRWPGSPGPQRRRRLRQRRRFREPIFHPSDGFFADHRDQIRLYQHKFYHPSGDIYDPYNDYNTDAQDAHRIGADIHDQLVDQYVNDLYAEYPFTVYDQGLGQGSRLRVWRQRQRRAQARLGELVAQHGQRLLRRLAILCFHLAQRWGNRTAARAQQRRADRQS